MQMTYFKHAVWMTLAMLLASPMASVAQGQSEINMIAVIGQELLAQRQAAIAAAEEAAHQARLEEQSRLREAYKKYLGVARRTAQALVNEKRRGVTEEQIEAVRRQGRIIIEEVTDETKQRVTQELDPLYAELEKKIAITPEEMYKADENLKRLRKELVKGAGNQLDWVDEAAILYALCPNERQAEVIAGNIHHRDKLSADEAEAIDLLNRRRLVMGFQPLAIDMKLVEASRDHSADMKRLGFFSHTSPVEGKSHFTDRAANFGTTAHGENIANGYNSGDQVTLAWWHSPGHLKNLMRSNFKRIGVGQKIQHYTQLFGG